MRCLFQSLFCAPLNGSEVDFVHGIIMGNRWRVDLSLHGSINTTVKCNFNFEINYIFWSYTILVFSKIKRGTKEQHPILYGNSNIFVETASVS
jgi:hypothetical protein